MTFDAPFKSDPMQIKPEWIDYNGHLNLAFYHVLFDTCIDEAFILFGLGPDYVKSHNASFFTLEAHVNYLRELSEGDPVYVTLQLLDYDHKRTHFFQQLYHGKEGFLSATSEQLSMHVDLESKRGTPFPDDVLARIAAMSEAHKDLARPSQIGSTIGIRHKS